MARTAVRRRVFGVIAVTVTATAALMSAPANADPWQPGTPPLSTPWTDDVGPDNALPEYPRPQLTRDAWQNLNGVWEFAGTDDLGTPPVGQTLDERILVPYPVESALSGIQRSEERMFYRRTFEVSARWKVGRADERLVLHFGAVDYDATVWVNGAQVTTHRGGYDRFSVDITDALTGSGPQELIVGVEDRTDATWQPVGKQRQVPDRGIFYTGSSGIWQTVWLEPVSANHITELDMTPKLADGSLALTAHTAGAATVEAIAYDGEREVGRVRGPANSPLRLPVPDAKLWSPDSPFLYDLRVRVLDGKKGRKAADEVGSYFGMREIGMKPGADGKLRMTLNGEIVFHMSTLDQGFWPDGIHTAPTDEALRFDLEQHKELGFNTVRKHIKVEPDRWFYHADRLGLLVWQDMPSMKTSSELPPPDARAEFERQLHTMVDQHDSWTSVVAWVPFNEGWGEWDRAETGRIADEVKAQDPSRLVNAHSGVNCCASKGDSGRGDMIDHHAYVGPAQAAPDANRVSVDGEHGGFGLEVEDHMWFGEGHAYEMTPDSATLTRRYVENQRDVLKSAQSCGISGAVYTQITDVEHEVNGFFTYDRQVKKMDFAQVRAVNEEI
ncbi:MAG: glycoside hydrolase family 2 protein, partial [Thermocrispum sp.]